MAAVEYGTIGIRPMGGWDPDTKYDLLNLVDYDGSSYVAHMDPPKGSLPTDTNYWQTSAQGTSKATADSVGTVKPDGTTTEVSTDGSLSVKTATQDALGLVKGSDGINVGSDGSIDLNTAFTQATELANIIAEEAIASVLGKISKSIAVTMNLDQNALLKNMLTNMDANDPNKINTAAYVHTLTERIGMGEELTAGANLTDGLNTLNSNLDNHVMLSGTNCEIVYNKAICILKIQAIGISLIGGNAINSNKFTLPTNVHLNFNIYEKLALLDSNWTPYSPANDCYVSSLSNGTINIRCSANVTNAVLVGSIILPRSAVSIT
jgi:hypothetical protein